MKAVIMTRFFAPALATALGLCSPPAWSETAKDPAVPPGKSAASQPPSVEMLPSASATAPNATEMATESAASTSETTSIRIDYRGRRRQALVDYNLGKVDPALEDLRALVTACEKEGSMACPDKTRAELYVALAIVLAGGKDDIKGAARLFHAALTRDPSVTVPRELATRPVQQAMREANESTSYAELSGPSTDAGASPEQDSASDPTESIPPEEAESPHDNKTLVILLHGIAGTGADDFSDGPSYGAAAVFGARFVDSSAWTTAIRGRVAAIGIDQALVGGAALLMGGTWRSQEQNRMGYFLGGLGIDAYGGEGGVSLNGMGGVSLAGFLIGGGLEVGASNYGSFAMIGLHLGWGAAL